MEIIKCATAEEATRKATDAINEALQELSVGVPTLFLLSGGSALHLLSGIRIGLLGPHLTITVLDERYSEDPQVNNFSQLSRTLFYHHAQDLGVQFIDTQVRLEESLKELAERFESSLFAWSKANPAGKVMATMGIGFDGHTAGILPYPEDAKFFDRQFNNPKDWVAAYDAGMSRSEFPLRVTTTLEFLRSMVDFGIVYATGDKKIAALQHALADTGELAKTPARIIKEMKQVRVFTDIAV